MYRALEAELFYWDGSLNGAIAMMEWADRMIPEDATEAPDFIRLRDGGLDSLIPAHSWVVKLGDTFLPCSFDLPAEVLLGKG